MKRTPLERRTPIKGDPEKAKAWRARTQRNLPAESARRKAERPARKATREVVLARDQGCQARGILPGRCWHPAGEPLDVHEVVRRSRDSTAYLDPEKCLALCRGHHQWVTTHDEEAKVLGFSASAGPVHNRG